MGKISRRNIGLNEWARKFVTDECLIMGSSYETRIFIDGRKEERVVPIIKPGPVKRVCGGFSENYCGKPFPLHHYIFPNYSVIREEIQRSVKRPDDHPCFHGEPGDHQIETIFLCLLDEKGRRIPESMWTEDEIEKALA